MNIVSLFNPFMEYINEFLSSNPSFSMIESQINITSNDFSIEFLRQIVEFIDIEFKNSKNRKDKYYIHNIKQRTLITSLGILTFNKTYYKSKYKIDGKYKFYSFIEDELGIEKWAKMTLNTEVKLINNAVKHGMEDASKNTIPNVSISRQTISKKIKNINYNYIEDIKRIDTPDTIYIEADEVHCNLQDKSIQHKKNKIVPVILIHEGHKEYFTKRKELKNKHYISSSIVKPYKLWNEAYKYLDIKYDINKIKYLFVSGDGGTWIKEYLEVFPNAVYVFDKFHYKRDLNYIFKKDILMINIADEYLRNKDINVFKSLVNIMINKYPHQKDSMIKKRNLLINNIDGIINQRHLEYNCPCAMEGQISNYYAKRLTSRPFSFSKDGLENIVQLITMKANNIELTDEIYYNFKHNDSYYNKINLESFISKFKNFSHQYIDPNNKYLSTIYHLPALDYHFSFDNTLAKSIVNSKF